VDLIEVDAASRTKVEDTRELLENVQYTPTQGRFKVYLIDEVHMLSKHSFNALLKTLEEPPPHIKFLLATTDPQRLPVTVLSRCLQFNLKRLMVGEIQAQLEKICAEESITADAGGLKALSKAAEGSMRDALSLLDQAIAFCGGEIKADSISSMLGTIDRKHVIRLIEALSKDDGSKLMNEVALLDEQAPDYGLVLDELMSTLQRTAVIQLVGESEPHEEDDALSVLALKMLPEDVQLYYQIALQGRRDLDVCRDFRSAFEMTLLRMLAFRPGTDGEPIDGAQTQSKTRKIQTLPAEDKESLKQGRAGRDPVAGAQTQSEARKIQTLPAEDKESLKRDRARREPARAQSDIESEVVRVDPEDWGRLLVESDIRGASRRLAEHCVLSQHLDNRLELILAPENSHLNTEQVQGRLQDALSEQLSGKVLVAITVGETPRETPAQIRAAGEDERMRSAREAIEGDPAVKEVQSEFDAVLEVDSIQPLDNDQQGREGGSV
jgi:DNA polymerase-3 subunit gamma/tau